MVYVAMADGRVDEARIERVAAEIATAAAHVNASEHQLLTKIREFIEIGGWAHQNALSPAHWLSWWIKVDLITAREKVRVAMKLGELKQTDAALERSAISYTQARAIARVASEKTEPFLLQHAEHATGQQLEKICRGFRRSKAALESPRPYVEEERSIRRRELDDGRVDLVIKGLQPDEASRIEQAIEAALAQIRRGTKAVTRAAASDSAEAPAVPEPAEAPTTREEVAEAIAPPPERHPAAARVAALVAVCEAFVAALPAGRVRSRTELIVSVDRTALLDATKGVGHLRDGSALSPATLRRLACDASVVELLRGPEGQTVDVGRARRTIPAAILRGLEDRDGGCIFPGCRNDRWVDGHHLKHWIEGGETKLENLCLMCRFHHQRLHEGHYTLTCEDGRFLFHDREGRRIVDNPRLPDLGPEPWAAVQASVPAELELARTAFAQRWDGIHCDYTIAIEGLADAEGLVV